MAIRIGVVLGAIGMVTGAAGAALGGLALGDTGSIAGTAAWALTFTALASVLGLGVGMIVRHSAAAISGLIVWWLVVENLLWAFLPATVSRFLPFYAGGALLGIEVDTATPETIAVALSRTQDALLFGATQLSPSRSAPSCSTAGTRPSEAADGCQALADGTAPRGGPTDAGTVAWRRCWPPASPSSSSSRSAWPQVPPGAQPRSAEQIRDDCPTSSGSPVSSRRGSGRSLP
jgi:hypothetical protein